VRGGSASQPVQATGSAVGRSHETSAAQTLAAGSTLTTPLAIPPAVKGATVGKEVTYPDPAKAGAQCINCPPGTVPVHPGPGAKVAKPTQTATLTQERVAGFVEGRSTELTSLRTETSTTYANPDGTRTARMYSTPKYAKDAAGVLVPIDTELAMSTGGRYAPKAALGSSFSTTTDSTKLAALSLGDVEVGFGVQDALVTSGAANGSEVAYDNIRPGADLIVEATPTGFKDKIVLSGPDSPTTWRFPLSLRGLTPKLLPGGRVAFQDAQGENRLSIPPGFMYDSTPDPRTGRGVRSNGVAYNLVREVDGWVLEVTLDRAWLRRPERVFPVVVDPPLSVRETRFIDTFVSSTDFANRDNGDETFLKVGTYNGGVEKSATYIDFHLADPLFQSYIVGASLNVYQTWARSCTNATLNVHNVTQSWFDWEPPATSWPGPSYESTPIGSKSFNRGGNCTSKPAGWESISIDARRFTTQMDMLHSWYGFALRASNTDNNAEKLFMSGENPAGGGPFLDVLYSYNGAEYSLPRAQFEPPVTPSTYGFLDVRVLNLGRATWPRDGAYNLWARIKNSSGVQVQQSVGGAGYDVYSLTSGLFPVVAGPLPAGNYTIELDMQLGTNPPFSSEGIPIGRVSFTVVPEATPQILSIFPANNSQVDTLTPTLWAQYYDADNAPGTPNYWFEVCNGTPSAPLNCENTGWITSSTWTVPAGKFSWGKTSYWSVAVFDGQNMSYLEGPYYLTPVAAQPEVTYHLARAPENPDIAGINPQVGNFSTVQVDANVAVVGPPLEIRRTYNSQDFRGNTADYNLALGRAATSSAACSANEGPEKAVNGSVSGGTSDKWCSLTAPRWLQVDLGGVQTVRSFVVRHAGAGGESATWNTKDYNIQISTDGTTWTTAATIAGNTANVTTTTITASSARYVKLNITTPAQDTNAAARIYEFEVMGNDGAFGSGWATPLNQGVANDPDGSGNAVVTLADGQQIRFGKNADGSFAPPPGYPMTLKRGTSDWTLRDATGEKRVFNNIGRLTTVTDAYGRQQQYLYTAGRVTQIKDLTSGRSLNLTWTDGRVTTVKADAPIAGGAQPTWNYSYTGNQLTKVCTPLSTTECTQYQYTPGSHYRSVVTDDNPVAYYPMTESNGGTAVNVVARKPGEFNGSYTTVTLGQTGALAGTTDKAASFTGASTMALPDNLLSTTMAFSIELWFKAASGKTGVLYGEQNTSLNQTPTHWSPALYVGTDGKLHARVWSASGGTQVVSTPRVDNNAWHHVVLSASLNNQYVYLDGVRIGQILGFPVFRGDMNKSAIGNGYTASTHWPNAGAGYFPFTGLIDDVALYRHPLGALQVSAHYAARNATTRMTKVIEPNAYTSSDVTYDASSGRVATVKDLNGATWNVGQPVLGDGTRTVALSSSGRDTVTYTYDANRGGRLTSRKTGDGTETWGYDANGFVGSYTDANGRPKTILRDARGNVTWEAVLQSGAWRWKNYGYYLNAADPLDPRNDRAIWQSGTRNAWDNDPLNRIKYDIDAYGRITKITHPGAAGAPVLPIEVYAYTDGTEAATGGGTTPPGLVKSYTNPLAGVTASSYNSRGDLVRKVDPHGLTQDYTYDLLGRSVARTDSAVDGGTPVTYGTWQTVYNAANLVTSETAPGIPDTVGSAVHTSKTDYTYDSSGRVLTKTVGDTTGGDVARVWTYTYDSAGRVRTIRTPDGLTETKDWNSAGDLARDTKPNGLVTEYRYDDARRLVETVASGTGVDPQDPNATSLVLESRAYDPAGQLASVVDAMGRETAYTYHTDGLLATEKRVRRNSAGDITSTTQLAAYEYDYGGNLIRLTGPGGVTQDFDYDDAGLRNRESIDAAGVARTTVRTFAADGSVTMHRTSNGYNFLTGRSAETPHLLSAGGSQIDGAGNRYVDGTATMTYRFTLPADAVKGTVNLEIDNQYLIQFSSDNTNWTEIRRETRDIRDGSNRIQSISNIDSYLAASKTLYVKISDSIPSNGWGGALSRVSVEYTRSGQSPAKTSYTYDTAGSLLTTTVDNPGGTPAGLLTQTVRDPRGLIKRTIDPTGATTAFTYDAAGHLVTTVAPARTTWVDGVRTDGVAPVTVLGRNTFGEIVNEKSADGAITATVMDQMGRGKQVRMPAYTPPGGLPVNAVLNATFAFDAQPLTTTDQLGRVTSYTYDLFGRVKTKTRPDPDGTGALTAPQWSYSYDRNGEMLETTDPTGAKVSSTYNDLGYQDTETKSERTSGSTVYFTTRFGRDDAGLMTSLTTPLNHTNTVEYSKVGEPTKLIDASGVTTLKAYDAQGRLVSEITGGAAGTSYRYDAAGRQIGQSDHPVSGGVLGAALRTQTVSYDAAGRPLHKVSAAGRITDYAYDAGGNPVTITQLVNSTDPTSGITVQQGFDAVGRRTRTVDGNNNATDYTYNPWGLLEQIREPDLGDPNARTWTLVYNAAGRQIEFRQPGGVVQTRAYDDLGRLLTESGTDAESPTTARTFAYDALDRTTGVSDPAGGQTYTYSDRGLLTQSTGPGGTTAFTYDGEANLVGRVGGGGTGTFTYDNARRLKTVADPLTGRTLTYSYGVTGQPDGISFGAGLPSRAYTYDALRRLATDSVKNSSGTTVLSTVYDYDLDDNVTGKDTTGFAGAGPNDYAYDGLGRLTAWTAGSATTTYGYDGASNRTGITTAAGTRTLSYDVRNRLTSASGGGQPSLINTWSARGTLASSTAGTTTTTFTSDAFDKPTQVTADTTTITYGYDALGRLTQRGTATLAYADMTNNPVSGPTATGQAQQFRAPDGTLIADKHGSGASRLVITDLLHGDTVGAIDSTTGAPQASRSYDPMGTPTATTGDFASGFQGGWTDPVTGQVNALARWYDPGQGTFASRDTATLDADLVQQINRYAYGNANPVTLNDPNGNCPVCAIGLWELGVLVVAAVTAYVVVDYWAKSGAAEDCIRALYNLGNAAVTGTLDFLHDMGVSAWEAVKEIQRKYASNAAVQSITSPVVGALPAPPVAVNPPTVPKIEVPKVALPAIGQTITQTVAPVVTLLPAGQQLVNALPTTIAIATPSILLANADGFEDATKVVAAAAAAEAVTELADTGDPGDDCNDEEKTKEWLLEIFEQAIDKVLVDGLDGLDDLMTQAQKAALERLRAPDENGNVDPKSKAKADFLERVFRGQRFHLAVRDWLLNEYPDEGFRYRSGGKNNEGPDFFHGKSGTDIELTTPGEEAAHRRRGGSYDTCLFSFYTMPTE